MGMGRFKGKTCIHKNWADSCPDCGSVDISHELVEKMVIQPSSDPGKCNNTKNLKKEDSQAFSIQV